MKAAFWRWLSHVPVLFIPLRLARLTVRDGYLLSSGWLRSGLAQLPVDRSGRPLPWYTYAAIEFLSRRVEHRLSVFEYGSGNSTLWWLERSHRVVSCEHDAAWHQRMQSILPVDAEYLLVELGQLGRYARSILAYGQAFDIVVIDGRDRVACASASLEALRPGGVIVWDNSDRPDYAEGYDLLRNRGFRRLDFWGPGPINPYGWCTSVFYRPDNCLGL